jgi:hypothetical protein
MKDHYQVMDHYDLNKTIGFLCGMIGGVTKFVCDAPINWGEYCISTTKAGFAALVCGFLGVAGKEIFGYIKKKYFSHHKVKK